MSDKTRSDGNEPSMEEILASIRKIISEDAEGDASGTGGARAQEGAQKPDETSETADAEVVDLTETADAAEEQPLDLTEDAESDDTDSPAESDDAVDLDASEHSPDSEDSEGPDAAEAEDPFASLAGADIDDSMETEIAATADEAAEPQESDPTMATPAHRQPTVSEQTEEAAVDQLTELARAANAAESGDDRPKSDADRILEQMVREALRPQLQNWLDENLPKLVERIVREEMRRMTRRAETTVEDEEA